jgi:hypothetical protein
MFCLHHLDQFNLMAVHLHTVFNTLHQRHQDIYQRQHRKVLVLENSQSNSGVTFQQQRRQELVYSVIDISVTQAIRDCIVGLILVEIRKTFDCLILMHRQPTTVNF